MALPHREDNKAANKRRARRKPPLTLRWLRLSLRLQAMLSTSWAVSRLYRLWFVSPKYTEPKRETHWREQAEQFSIPHEYGPLAAYRWGHGERVVLLIHGWSGRGPQMGAFAEPLVNAGYSVIAFDAPSHGRTPGSSTNLFRISDALQTVIQHCGPVDSIISHSFGTIVLAYTLRHRDLHINRAVCIGSPASARLLADRFTGIMQASAKTRQCFMQQFEREFGHDIWNRISAEENARGLTIPALIMHDQNDHDVPWQSSQQLAQAWPNAKLVLSKGLGHRRILRNPTLVKQVVDFITH